VFNPQQDNSNKRKREEEIFLVNVKDDVFHNVLYFIYTGLFHVEIPTNGTSVKPPESYPRCVDAYSLYRVAVDYLMDDLKELSFQMLRETCTVNSALKNLFDGSSAPAEVEDFYVAFLAPKLSDVVQTQEWKLVTSGLENNPRHRRLVGRVFDYKISPDH